MSRISPFAHIFVSVVFAALGLSFLLSTALLIAEFKSTDWQLMLFSHSHLFFFFPVFGLLVLLAFYKPSIVFTDFYWRKNNLKFGRLRFIFGAFVVAAVSLYYTAELGKKQPRGLWEISPDALTQDLAAKPVQVPDCVDEQGKPCVRIPFMTALSSLHSEGQKRTTVTEFARNCKIDTLMEMSEADRAARWCFPAGTKLQTEACCKVQKKFNDDAFAQFSSGTGRSKISKTEEYLTFFKVFFVVVLLVIGLLMVFWQDDIARTYEDRLPSVERGVIVGAIAMLFWVLMDYGYQQTTDVLVGRQGAGFPLRLSLVVAPWAALLLIYFVKRMGSMMYNAAQISTIIGSAVAVLRYEQISNSSVRWLGSAAETWIFVALIALAVFSVGLVHGPWKLPLPPARRHPNQKRMHHHDPAHPLT